MKELSLENQMEINGGGVGTVFFYVVIGAALYKVFRSTAGRVSIPRLVSIEWR